MTTRDYDSDANFFAYYFPITTPSPELLLTLVPFSVLVTSAKMFARLERRLWFHSTRAGHMIKGVCNTLGDVH